jgi:hypothetical protein
MFTLPLSFVSRRNVENSRTPIPNLTNLQVALSLCKIITAYSGDCIQISNAADTATSEIGFDGDGNLDTAAIASFYATHGGIIYVSRWYNQVVTGSPLSYIDNAAGSRPAITDSGGVVYQSNGRNTIYFAGSQWLFTDSGVDISQPNSVLFVGERLGAGNIYLMDLGGGSNRNLFYFARFGGNIGLFAVSPSIAPTLNSTVGVQKILGGLFNTSSSYVRLGGVQESVVDPGSSAFRLISIGGHYGGGGSIIGYVSEALVYDSDETSNFPALEKNMQRYYNTALN